MEASTPPSLMRQRRGVSFTNVPASEGNVLVETTPIPTNQKEKEEPLPSKVLSGSAVAKDENRTRKIFVRVLSGALMVSRAAMEGSE